MVVCAMVAGPAPGALFPAAQRDPAPRALALYPAKLPPAQMAPPEVCAMVAGPAPGALFEYSWIPIVPSREKVTGERGTPSTRIAIRLAPSVTLKLRLRLSNIHGFP